MCSDSSSFLLFGGRTADSDSDSDDRVHGPAAKASATDGSAVWKFDTGTFALAARLQPVGLVLPVFRHAWPIHVSECVCYVCVCYVCVCGYVCVVCCVLCMCMRMLTVCDACVCRLLVHPLLWQ